MFNKEEFVKEFIEAAVAEDNDKMQELAKQTQELGFETRIDVLEKVIEGVKDLDGQEELTKGLEGTLQIMRLAEEVKNSEENSTGEEAKDESKAEEATQDVAADTSAPIAEDSSVVEEGDAPAEEEKAEKPSDEA